MINRIRGEYCAYTDIANGTWIDTRLNYCMLKGLLSDDEMYVLNHSGCTLNISNKSSSVLPKKLNVYNILSDGSDHSHRVFQSSLLRFSQWRTDGHCYDHIIWMFLLQSSQARGWGTRQMRRELSQALQSHGK